MQPLRLILAGIICWLAATAVVAVGTTKRFEHCNADLAAGAAALRRADGERAGKAYQSALETALLPAQRHLACAGRAEAEFDQRSYRKAIADYDTAIAAGLRTAFVFGGRGAARQARKDDNGALADYAQAIQLEPNYPFVFLHRFEIYRKRQDFPRAIADLSEAIRCQPNNVQAFATRGWLWHLAGSNDRALADFDAALRLSPYFSEAYQDRAALFYSLKKETRAAADAAAANACRELNVAAFGSAQPALVHESWDTSFSFGEAARAAEEAGAHAQAILFYTAALASPRIPQINVTSYLMNRGLAKSAAGDELGAVRDYNAAIAIDPTNDGVFVDRATSCIRLGELDQAIADCTAAIRLNSARAEAYVDRGDAYAYKRQEFPAMADYDHAIDLDPIQSTFYIHRAQAETFLHRPWEALADSRSAIRLSGQTLAIQMIQARAYLETKQWKAAAAIFREARPRAQHLRAQQLNMMAWFYATGPDPALRDPAAAIALAQLACAQSGWKEWHDRDTLAAAYASAGDFRDAVAHEEAALRNTDTEADAKIARQNLALYRNGQPYLQGTP